MSRQYLGAWLFYKEYEIKECPILITGDTLEIKYTLEYPNKEKEVKPDIEVERSKADEG